MSKICTNYKLIGNGILYKGDCLETMRSLADGSVDLIFADPPYNTGKDYGKTWNNSLPIEEYLSWIDLWVKEGFRLLKDTGSFFFLINSKNGHKIANILDKYGIHRNAIIWQKKCAPIQGRKNLAKNYRILYFYSKTTKLKFYPESIRVKHRYLSNGIIPGRNPKGRRIDDTWEDISELVGGYLIQEEVVRFPMTKKPVLPAQCPEEVVRRAVLLTTETNDIILDPFLGMGTTVVVAEKENRRWIGIEINPRFCELITERVNLVINQGKLL